MEDENPPVIATGTFGVVAVQEVKDAIVGVIGASELVEVLLELPPPQATITIGNTARNILSFIIFIPRFTILLEFMTTKKPDFFTF